MMNVAEEHEDILQNIELAIVGVYRADDELVDYDVEKALDALVRVYQAEQRRRDPPVAGVTSDLAQAVLESVRSVCEWRLGREAVPPASGQLGDDPGPDPVSLDVIIACLKRVRKSVRFWTKERGYKGYLTFITQFL